MDSMISRLFIQNWQRKGVALVIAIVIWLLVNHSITDTKTIPNVPIRIVNLPQDKTIKGLLPNGILSRRVALTISGTKDVIKDLEPGDIEVLLDASLADSSEWIVQITKKNLVSLNPSTDLTHHISNVNHSDFVIKLTRLVTAKVPIKVNTPIGEPPFGYELLDIWPQKLTQTVSGPEEEINELKTVGLEVTFDLKDVSKSDLDNIKQGSNPALQDEISFPIPTKWKVVTIPFQNNAVEPINDLEAYQLHIDFLRKSTFEMNKQIPISVFYPIKYLDTINPETYPLATNDRIKRTNGVAIFSQTVFVKEVSRLFIDIVRENVRIHIIVAPKSEREALHWSVDVVDVNELEDLYVAYHMNNSPGGKVGVTSAFPNKKRETNLRKRFRYYLQKLVLYSSPEHRLNIEAKLEENQVKVN